MKWKISGSYYEACNCQAVCPCRRQNGAPGGRSNYGVCQFLLSWIIIDGEADLTSLSGLSVAIAGFYNDDEPGEPWSVKLFIDERATEAQFRSISDIFLGRAGGDMQFNQAITVVFEIKRAVISLVHGADHKEIVIAGVGGSRALHPAPFEGTVTCGIPGHHQPGTEYVSSLHIADGPLQWSYAERCGFASNFAFSN